MITENILGDSFCVDLPEEEGTLIPVFIYHSQCNEFCIRLGRRWGGDANIFASKVLVEADLQYQMIKMLTLVIVITTRKLGPYF